jgi:hypothetical protein
MMTLSTNWFVEGWQDFEYKKYVLLAYLQSVKQAFDQSLLYPVFADLMDHYQNLQAFRQRIERLERQFPRELSALDWEQHQVVYSPAATDDEALRTSQEIVAYALPRLHASLQEGHALYASVDAQIEIDRVGLLPLRDEEGYLLLRAAGRPEVSAYRYRFTVIERAQEGHRAIHTEWMGDFPLGVAQSLSSIKHALVRRQPFLPNPATFAVSAKLPLPLEAAIMPVAKRKLVRMLAEGSLG